MSIILIKKSIIPLLVATVLLGGFFWQFTTIYSFLIENFKESSLYILYSHLTIYTFLVFILMVSFINLLNHFLLKSKIFIAITLATLLLFYTISYDVFADLFHYFLNVPLSEESFMGLIIFTVMTFSYALYSLFLLLLNRFIPLIHILIFTLLGIFYSALFINAHCYPILEIADKF
jgi:hypothetical protein